MYVIAINGAQAALAALRETKSLLGGASDSNAVRDTSQLATVAYRLAVTTPDWGDQVARVRVSCLRAR